MDRYVKKAIRDLYRKHVDPKREADPALFEGILQNFNKAVDVSVNSKKHGGFAHELCTNNEVYSAFRSHRMGRDMAAKMLDEDGKLKSFTKFREDVKPIADHHVKHWLETEYNTAVHRAHQAEQWKKFQEDKDIFPNLRWVESTAVNPDPEHRTFWGIVRPVDDPFWSAHRPGDHWGCHCSLEQTDDPVTDAPDGAEEDDKNDPSPGLEENPAETGRIFSDKGPFFPSSCASCPFSSMLQAAKEIDFTAARKKDCYNCSAAKQVIEKAKRPETWKTIETKAGRVRVSSLHGKNEMQENVEIASHLANRHKHEIDLLAKNDEKKDADAYNHTLQCKQEFKRNVAGTANSIDTAIRYAKDQADDIVLDIRSDIPEGTLSNAIKKRVKRSSNVKSIWIIKGEFDRQYTREEILSEDFKIQWD